MIATRRRSESMSTAYSASAPPKSDEAAWHTWTVDAAYTRFKTSSHGLSGEEAARRLLEHGPNELASTGGVSLWSILLEQFKNALILILLVAVALSFFLGHSVEAIAIAVIVFFAVTLGFLQEYRAERAMHALRQMAAPTATVLRDGQEVSLDARQLVPGDVIILSAGNRIPADARLVEAVNLQLEEAALTGESIPVSKQTEVIEDPDAALGDRANLVFAGTAVTYGRGRAVVVATGMQTEFGKIATMLTGVETGRTPLQENLSKVGRSLAKAAIVVVVMIVALGLARGQPFVEMLIFGIALAVAVVPEALPAVVTISLAIGVQRMVKRNALMRRLPAVETLGSTSVICSDKTGTLTKDEMTVRKLVVAGRVFDVSGAGYEPVGQFSCDGRPVEPSREVVRLLTAATLVSDAFLTRDEPGGNWRVKGDPTEGAIVVASAKAGLKKEHLDSQYIRAHEIPFSSETKRMTTVDEGPAGTLACSKGAPEVILAACARLLTADGDAPLDAQQRERIQDSARQLASQALRVLGVADKPGAGTSDAESDMTFLGLLGMIDPPRPEAKAAIAKCESAGIKVVMITGDHPLTAEAIARELGILKSGKVASGADLEGMSDSQLERAAPAIEVYARVSPAHKLRVVSAFQKQGHVVAMTGDGVNDAPALKKADIGIAMGITGTDVTREAAAMTLIDDNFASIVAAVEEGRVIFGNIKKYLMYLLSANIGEIGLMTGASLLGLPMPLTAVQILYVNLATDGLPALALAVDPPEDDNMRRPPRDPRTGIFAPSVVRLMLLGGAWSAITNLSLFIGARYLGYSDQAAMTMTFVSLVLMEFFKAYAYRSDHQHVLHRPFSNRWLNVAIIWEIALLLLILYVPFLERAFEVSPLSVWEWAFLVFWSHTILPVLEFGKWLESQGIFTRRLRPSGPSKHLSSER
jgi:Ca2+-transporting ATPase